MTDSLYCPRCATLVEANCDFCTNCGSPKPQPAPASTPPPPHQWMQQAAGHGRQQAMPPQPQYQAPTPVAYAQPPAVIQRAVMPEKATVAQVSLVTAIVMLSLAFVALIPCLGSLNWLNLFVLAEVQHITWWVSFFSERNPRARVKRLLALPFFLIAVFIGIARLIIGGGCL